MQLICSTFSERSQVKGESDQKTGDSKFEQHLYSFQVEERLLVSTLI